MNFYDFIQDCGLSFDSASLSFSIVNPKRIPSLIFSPSSYQITLFYQAPNNFGQQSFSFDPDIFLSAYYNSRYKRSVPKSDYLSFNDLFFSSNYPSANNYVRLIFSCFLINPSVIKKLSNRKSHSRLKLKPSRRSLLVELGLSSSVYNFALKSPDFKQSPEYQEELVRINYNLSKCVSLAASSFDLSYFNQYLSFYKELRSLNHLSTHLSNKQISNLLASFSDKVDKLQKSL